MIATEESQEKSWTDRGGQTEKKDGSVLGLVRLVVGVVLLLLLVILLLVTLLLVILLAPPLATFSDPRRRRQGCLTSRKDRSAKKKGEVGVGNTHVGGDDAIGQEDHLTKMPKAPPGQSEPPTIENPKPGRPGALWRGWWNTQKCIWSILPSSSCSRATLYIMKVPGCNCVIALKD